MEQCTGYMAWNERATEVLGYSGYGLHGPRPLEVWLGCRYLLGTGDHLQPDNRCQKFSKVLQANIKQIEEKLSSTATNNVREDDGQNDDVGI